MIPPWAIRTKADEAAIEAGCIWDQKQADRIILFTEAFFKSQFIPGDLKLLPEQKQILQSLYGWRLPNGNRRFKFANLHFVKKGIGKTLLAAVLALYELIGSGEPSPVVYAAACSIDNAAQIFDELHYSIQHGPFKPHAAVKTHSKSIHFPQLNARFKSCASDGKRLHGPNCSLVVLDECHEHRNSSLWDALRYAPKARPNGLVVAISTAGNDVTHWYHAIYQKSKRILSGEDLDTTHYALVHEMDQDGNPEDPAQWVKANPLLGQPWCTEADFKRELVFAKTTGLGAWLTFQRLNLNKWVRPDELAYFDVTKWDTLEAQPVPPEDELKVYPASIGVDLSEAGDPTSVVISWLTRQGEYYSRAKCWVARDVVKKRESSNLPKYSEFISAGDMIETKGDMLDERDVCDYIVSLCKQYDVRGIYFDPRNAYLMANRIEDETGIKCLKVPPNAKFFNAPMRELNKAMEEGRWKHDGSGWLKFCLQNVRVTVNQYEEVYPARKRSVDKVDGAISSVLALFGLMAEKEKTASVIRI